jgi:Sulfotransferase family
MKILSLSRIKFWWLKQKARNVVKKNRFPGKFKRIYHFHIRKSAGTSVNAAFWRLAGKELKDVGRSPLIVTDNHVFVRHNRELIARGDYFFANSHAPFWQLSLPDGTFTFTIFRDPVARLYSLYRYYHFNVYHKDAPLLDPMNASVRKYESWLGNSFMDFLERLPRQHLENQLYMFSETFNIDEAVKNVQKLNNYYFQEDLDVLASELSEICGQKLVLTKERTFPYTIGEISSQEQESAAAKLIAETKFYHILKSKYRGGSKQ